MTKPLENLLLECFWDRGACLHEATLMPLYDRWETFLEDNNYCLVWAQCKSRIEQFPLPQWKRGKQLAKRSAFSKAPR